MSESWQIGPFVAHPGALLGPEPRLRFRCPVSQAEVAWAAKDVFNPGAVVRDGRVHLLVRAEDTVGAFAGCSRIGLARSDDGLHFELDPEPVLFPDADAWSELEWPGGCEDPRVVESPDGGYVCLYSAFDGRVARLCVASSPDLQRWTKHGPAFADTAHAARWSKSGAIVTELHDGRLVAARIRGRYWMYWGEGICFAATSQDLIRWQPVEFDPGEDRALMRSSSAPGAGWTVERTPGAPALRPVAFARAGRFDSLLVEPGPPAVRTDAGIVLIYNGANHPKRGDPALPPYGYLPGQLLLDSNDPLACIARSTAPFLEQTGSSESQVANVCFAEGLVRFEERWWLYAGLGDSRIGCARTA